MDPEASPEKTLMTQSRVSNSSVMSKRILINCSQGCKAFQLCINQQCLLNTKFTCVDQDCKCHQEHQFCPKINLTKILNKIEQKVLKTDGIQIFIEQTIEKIIDQLSLFRQKLLDKVEKEMKYSQQFQIEKQILKLAFNQQTSKKSLSAKDSALLWKMVSTKEEKTNKLFDSTQEILKKLQKQSQQSITKFNTQWEKLIKNQLEDQQIKLSSYLSSLQIRKHQLSNNEKSLISNLVGKSSIVKATQQFEKLIKFFPKSIKNISLLFKASDHGFKLAKFFEICGKESNIMVICESQKGKIVGAYSPLCHFRQKLINDQTMVADPSEQSFMFSLTNNDKFYLVNKNDAVRLQKNREFVCFGYGEIYIKDNPLTESKCYLRCNYSYKNEKYKKEDKQSYLRFNGSQKLNCNIKMWQVWKVEIQ